MPRLAGHMFAVFAWASSLGVLLGIAMLLAYLAVHGGRVLGPDLVFGEVPWMEALLGQRPVFEGLWPALVGTVTLVGLTCVLAVPVGVAGGIWLAEYAEGRRRAVVSVAVDLLAGVPSIVMGLFGFALILLLRRTLAPHANTCLLLAAFCLALLVLPYLIRATQNALSGLPPEVRLVGPSLGLTRYQSVRHVLVPSASRGILAGVILSIGRAAEDTALIMLTGVVASAGLPRGLAGKFEALPFRIYVLAAEYRGPAELDRGFGAALVLLLAAATLFFLASRLERHLEKRWTRS
jgi:phosphate transport system permease protein